MRDIKDFSSFDEINETKEERKLKRASRKAKRAEKVKKRKEKAESKGKTRKANRLDKKIDKKKTRIVRLSDKFNRSNTSKRLKIQAIRHIKSVIKKALFNLKRAGLEDKYEEKIKNYKDDYKILDFLIKVVRKDMGSDTLEEYISKLKSPDIIELLEKALDESEDGGNISDEEISDATNGLVTSLPSNADSAGSASGTDDIFEIIRKHFLTVQDSFVNKVTTTKAPLLNTSLVKHSLEVVKFIQYMMNKLEFDADVEDGKYGNITKGAVKRFQTKYKLNVTGEVDLETWKKILTLIRIEFDPKKFSVYTANTNGGGGVGKVDEDLMARLKKWLKL